MQAIPAAGSPFIDQGLEFAPIIGAGGQVVEPDSTVEKSFFNKLLFQGLSMEKTAESNSESEGENLGETAAVQDDMPSEDIAEVNGLALCYFAPAQHIPTPVAAGIPNAEDLAHEIPGQDLRKPDLLVQVPAQDLQQPVEMSEATVEMSGQDTPAPNMRTAAFNQMPEPQVQEPQLFDENTEVQNKDPGQYEGHVRESAKAAPGDVAEKVSDLLRSMSDKSSREESFGHLLSREKELPQPEGTENQAISGVPYLQVSERDVVAAEKTSAVEKALNSFLEDLRGTESGGREIRIVLEPENLGELRISVTSTENGIVAKIKSDDREICAIISDQIQKLVQSMENKGITVENVDVLFEQAGRDMGFDGKSFGNGEERYPNRGYREEKNIDSVDGQGLYAWKGILDTVADGNGALEYRV